MTSQSGSAASIQVWQTAGAIPLSVFGFILGAGAIALTAMLIRTVLPAVLTGFTDWLPVAAPVVGVFGAAATCERFTPAYSRIAVSVLFGIFGALSVILSLLQPFPQPALQSLIWSFAFLAASAGAFLMPAIEERRASRRLAKWSTDRAAQTPTHSNTMDQT